MFGGITALHTTGMQRLLLFKLQVYTCPEFTCSGPNSYCSEITVEGIPTPLNDLWSASDARVNDTKLSFGAYAFGILGIE